jgi:flagellar motor switch protein FliN/FliY
MSDMEDALVRRDEAALREFARLMDIPLRMSIEVGRSRLRVRDLSNLSLDSVIELKKPAGDPFDLFINGVFVARGEVISVEHLTGLRIVEVQKPGSSA